MHDGLTELALGEKRVRERNSKARKLRVREQNKQPFFRMWLSAIDINRPVL